MDNVFNIAVERRISVRLNDAIYDVLAVASQRTRFIPFAPLGIGAILEANQEIATAVVCQC